MSITILSVCPDINYTTIAISKDEDVVYQTDIDHSNYDFLRYDNIMDQLPFRRDAIINQLKTDGLNIKDIQFVVAEGGLLNSTAPLPKYGSRYDRWGGIKATISSAMPHLAPG